MTVIGGTVLPVAPAAAAATHGSGGYWSLNGGWLGSYIHNGVRVYCVDSEVKFRDIAPKGALVSRIEGHPLESSTRLVTGDRLQKVNYAISEWGQQADNHVNAAVQAYVWELTNSLGRTGSYYLRNAPEAVRTAFDTIRADAEANFDAPVGAGSGELKLTIDPQNHYAGTLRVSGLKPANAVGDVTLTNAVFADTGSASRDGVTNNAVLPILGIPPGEGSSYRVRAEAVFEAEGKPQYEPNVVLFESLTSGWQRTATSGIWRAGSLTFSLSAEDSIERTVTFQPIVGTTVSARFVTPGENLADVLTFSTVHNEQGVNNPWYRHPQRGFDRVKATATVYGPFLAQPSESDDVPENAPIAATGIELETSAAEGPTVDYTVDSGFAPEEAGFYTWVWRISDQEQNELTRSRLPEGYRFQDRFGQVSESSVSASRLALTTQVVDSEGESKGESDSPSRPPRDSILEVGMLQPIADDITVSSYGGGWLQADGGRIPAVLTGTVYFSSSQPELAERAPDDAEKIGELTLTVNGPGTERSGSVRAPLREGYVTFHWCVLEERQPERYRGMLAEGCDAYGQWSETVRVVAPEVVTEATPLATIHDPIHDTAIVDGRVPENSWLGFELFERPAIGVPKRNVDGSLAEERWTEEMLSELDGTAVCTSANRVAQTAQREVRAGTHTAQRYESPSVRVQHDGDYWWVETLEHRDPETGETTLLHRGACGLPNETTVVDSPRVTTAAVPEIMLGDPAHDVATVDGPVPGPSSDVRTELTFELFRHEGGQAMCTETNRVLALDEPILVTAAGEYRSAEVILDRAGSYYWVETLSYVHEDGRRQIVHVGECGLPNETTRVVEPLALTGAEAQRSGGAVVASVLAALGLLVLATATVRELRRRQEPR